MNLTPQQAALIRKWRVDDGCSWRKVASLAAVEWPDLKIKTHPNGDGYQGEGMDLCAEAAEFFGENAGCYPWN